MLVDTNNEEIGKASVKVDNTSTIKDLRAAVHKAFPNRLKDIGVGRLKVI
jgi:hypothetical protein